MANVNYKELLIKYIQHVDQSEGINFINVCNCSNYSDVEFTNDEIGALTKCEEAYNNG